MAGKLLTLEEAAQKLGVSVEDVHSLIDRKKLYPLRDGNTLKFKHDEIERLATSEGDSLALGDSGLSLDVDQPEPKPAASGAISGVELADSLDLDLDGEMQLDVGGAAEATGSGGALSLGSVSGLEVSPVSGSASAAPATPPASAPVADADGSAEPTSGTVPIELPGAEPISRTLPIDLSGIDLSSVSGTGSNVTGSLVVGSGAEAIDLSGSMSNVGSALSGALEDGLSLEDSSVRESGILSAADFEDDMQSAIRASVAGKSGLAGEDIQEFDPASDDESGSVVVADESEAGSSSFLPDDESSSIFPDAVAAAAAGEDGDGFGASGGLAPSTTFSTWQVCGLVCCALLMLTGGFVMFDLIQSLGTSEELGLSSPLLNPMAELFGWRK